MTKLSDIQLVLLSTAAARPDGSLLPPPDTVGGQAARIHKTMTALLKRELVSEIEVTLDEQVWRREGERKIGVAITTAGREAVGVAAPTAPHTSDAGTMAKDREKSEAAPATKIEHVVSLMRRAEGATLADLVNATGWLPHTTRAALTGLRKKGHAIARDKRDGITTYSLPAA